MATGTFYLRPSADVSLEHKRYPETLSAGYLAINEEVADGYSTYILQSVESDESGRSQVATSVFAVSLPEEIPISKVISATLTVVHEVYNTESYYGYGNFTVTVNSADIFKTEDYSNTESETLSHDMVDVVTAINDYISTNGIGSFPDISVTVYSNTDYESKSTAQHKVDQLYIALECEYEAGLKIHHKVNGAWAQAQKAYQKQNGVWVEITEDECKAILQSKIITK